MYIFILNMRFSGFNEAFLNCGTLERKIYKMIMNENGNKVKFYYITPVANFLVA